MGHHILIDLENVQPKSLPNDPAIEVTVFVGPNQHRVPMDLVEAMQSLGDQGHYVRVSRPGKNALDFHIAYHAGRVSETHPGDSIEIISRDKGFDPLIEHLQQNGVNACRSASISVPPADEAREPLTEVVRLAVRRLNSRGDSRPARIRALENTIRSDLGHEGEEGVAKDVMRTLRDRRWIQIEDNKVTYALPDVI